MAKNIIFIFWEFEVCNSPCFLLCIRRRKKDFFSSSFYYYRFSMNYDCSVTMDAVVCGMKMKFVWISRVIYCIVFVFHIVDSLWREEGIKKKIEKMLPFCNRNCVFRMLVMKKQYCLLCYQKY
jgi:hypothetical protein